MATLILWNDRTLTKFDQRPRSERGVHLVPGEWRLASKLPLRCVKPCRAQDAVGRITPIVYEPDAVILLSRRRNKRFIGNNDLSGILQIDVHTQNDAVTVPIQRCPKYHVSVIRYIEEQV